MPTLVLPLPPPPPLLYSIPGVLFLRYINLNSVLFSPSLPRSSCRLPAYVFMILSALSFPFHALRTPTPAFTSVTLSLRFVMHALDDLIRLHFLFCFLPLCFISFHFGGLSLSLSLFLFFSHAYTSHITHTYTHFPE